jgi:hypothetical protein
MYYVFMTFLACLASVFGINGIDAGWYYTALCVFGGVLFGHVLTEALNDPSLSDDRRESPAQ